METKELYDRLAEVEEALSELDHPDKVNLAKGIMDWFDQPYFQLIDERTRLIGLLAKGGEDTTKHYPQDLVEYAKSRAVDSS